MTSPKVIETEVCVIGGGPGGAAASGYLNQKNIAHVVVEASTFPREKPCGDTVSIHVLNYIKDMMPEAHDKILSEAKLNPLQGINLYAPNNSSFSFKYPDLKHFKGRPSSYTISRGNFDNYLFQGCKSLENATVFEGTKVLDVLIKEESAEVITADQIIKCKLVIMASGCNGSLAAKFNGNVKGNDHFAMGVRAYFSGVKMENDNYAELILNKKMFLGGFYISALGNDLYNVNMVMKKGSVEHQKLNFRNHFKEQIENHPLLSKRFKDAKLESKIEGNGLMLFT